MSSPVKSPFILTVKRISTNIKHKSNRLFPSTGEPRGKGSCKETFPARKYIKHVKQFYVISYFSSIQSPCENIDLKPVSWLTIRSSIYHFWQTEEAIQNKIYVSLLKDYQQASIQIFRSSLTSWFVLCLKNLRWFACLSDPPYDNHAIRASRQGWRVTEFLSTQSNFKV